MKTLAAVESITGGLFSAKVTSEPGVSSFFKGSLVIYQNKIKEKLGIDTSHGVVNKDVALAMAQKGKAFFDVDYCVSFTGNAGPTSLDGKEVGKVFIALNDEVFELDLKGTRKEIQKQAVDFALNKLIFLFS